MDVAFVKLGGGGLELTKGSRGIVTCTCENFEI